MQQIKYVQLEPDAFLVDVDFAMMTAQERGVYWTLILYLYANGGKYRYDSETLKQLCRCEDFENVWEKIKNKFSTKNGFIRHRRVTRELKKAGQRLQAARKAGLMSVQKRQRSLNGCSNDCLTEAAAKEKKEKESKENVIEKGNKDITYSNTKEQSSRSSNSVRALAKDMLLYDSLVKIIKPKNQSDKTCFYNIAKWVSVEILKGNFNDEIYERIIDYANEAARAKGNNAAIFLHLLKKELNYVPDKCERA